VADTRWRGRRRLAAGLLVLAVVVVHGCITAQLADSQLGLGAVDAPARMEVDFVREMAQRDPVPVAAPRPKARRAAPAPVAAASAPEPAASAPELAPAPEEPASAVADAVVPAASAAPVEPAASAAAPAFEWPPSTRLVYEMTGDYRGPVEGTARVQWIRSGAHYQVHLDVSIALVASVKLTSDGTLTDAGLKPKSYVQESRVAFGEPRRRSLTFEDDHIVMVDGSHKPTLPAVQDAVSQLVQLGWIFAMQPERLQAGQSVEVPLALGRRVDNWRYDVLPPADIDTPMGVIKAWPVRPSQADGGGNPALKIESWIAPSMQYLPVRIHVDIDNGARMDLKLSGKPMQAP
jgi:hypothetical protein